MKYILTVVLLCVVDLPVMPATWVMDQFQMVPGGDCYGPVIGTFFIHDHTPLECERLCLALENCVAVVHDTYWNSCWAKSSCDQYQNVNYPYVNLYVPKPAIENFDRTPGKDCVSNDIAVHPHSTVDECSKICLAFDTCVAFVFDNDVAECWTKAACDTANLRDKAVADVFVRIPNKSVKRTMSHGETIAHDDTKPTNLQDRLSSILLKTNGRREQHP